MTGRPSVFASWHRRVAAGVVDLALQPLSGAPLLVGPVIRGHDAEASRTTTHDDLGQSLTTNGDPSGLAVALSRRGE